MAQTVLRLILLPWEAVLNASAIVTALWRMTVSHRDLLQWQTAAQRAAKRDGLGAYLRALWPASALGLLTVVLTPSPTGLAAGIVWTLSPFVLAALGAPNAPGAAPLTHAAQRELLGWAKATWQYFETFCTAGEHYLPPDNVQTQPPTGTAHRTSPTNMGFALLSALGAHALGVDNGRGLALAEQMLTTMEQLPRWNGHFYNWYHTCTLRPMPPLYVSTVDSGNCAAALLAAANALRGWGQDALAARAQALCDGMDFALLYDPQRRLMHIGIDTGSGKRSEGYYDLLESEARLTSYFAVARGDVPREHWRALSRAQVQHERYRGCVSWSGSVFEYLMPELFLPPQRDSLLWESAKFCLRVQRRRVRAGQPWGVSESAYFALDSALSYRYKAHGCAALAMQPDMDRELVLSPYSAFLALAVAPRAAVRDLRRFAARGLPGQYGFREALDCTRARTGGGGQIVHCVMAHHQGMSLLSACNALCGGQVQRWFLADPAMRAHMIIGAGAAGTQAPGESFPERTIAGIGKDMASRINLLNGQADAARTGVESKMSTYIALYAADDDSLTASVEDYRYYLDELASLTQLAAVAATDAEYRRCLEQLLRSFLTIKRAIDTDASDIHDQLDRINAMLKGQQFGPKHGSLSLHADVRRPERTFWAQLIRVIGTLNDWKSADVNDSDASRKAFAACAPMVGLLRAELAQVKDANGVKSYGARNLDPRCRSSFYAIVHHADGPDERITSTGGRSGGALQELTSFVYGAALIYLLGGGLTSEPSYTTLFLDEALIKADGRYTQRALTVLPRLGFQVIVSAPESKTGEILEVSTKAYVTYKDPDTGLTSLREAVLHQNDMDDESSSDILKDDGVAE